MGYPPYAVPAVLLLACLYWLTVTSFTLQQAVYSRTHLWLTYTGYLAVCAVMLWCCHGLGVLLARWLPGAAKILFIIGWFVTAALLVPLIHSTRRLIKPEAKRPRGRFLTPASEAKKVAESSGTAEAERIRFGGFAYAIDAIGPHYLIVGATGAGKSVTLQEMLESILPTITPGSDKHLLLYDAKGDMLPILGGMHPKVR